MGIYRHRAATGRRWMLVAALGLLLAGGALWTARRHPQSTPSPRTDPVQLLVDALEIVPVSYDGAVRDGAVVPGRDVQYRGARDALVRARTLFEAARGPLASRSPGAVRLVDEGLRDVEAAVRTFAPPPEVRERTERLARALRDAAARPGAGAEAPARRAEPTRGSGGPDRAAASRA
jgi:hypothetical protein